jgi:single-strand DNA-binding protein
MASLNLCQFIGNVGNKDSRFMTNGDQVVNLSIACNESYKDKSGESVEKTEWVKVVFYRNLASIVDKYVEKGKQIYISGRLQTRKWTDKQGVDHYSTEIVANEIKMLGGKTAASGNNIEKKDDYADIEDDIPF